MCQAVKEAIQGIQYLWNEADLFLLPTNFKAQQVIRIAIISITVNS